RSVQGLHGRHGSPVCAVAGDGQRNRLRLGPGGREDQCGGEERQSQPSSGTGAKVGGGRGIRTPDTLSGTTVFKTAAINHSAIPPKSARRRKCNPTGSRQPRQAMTQKGTPRVRRVPR